MADGLHAAIVDVLPAAASAMLECLRYYMSPYELVCTPMMHEPCP